MKKLKLNALAANELTKQKQAKVYGGCCICGCRGDYGNATNGGANRDGGGLSSPGGGTHYPSPDCP